MKAKLLTITLLVTCTLFGQLREVAFTEKIVEASLIIEGEILSKNSFYADNSENIYTFFEVNVFKVIKGDASNISNENRIYILLPGGDIGTESLHVEPNLNLDINEVGTILLKNNTVPATSIGLPAVFMYEPTQSAQSKYNYNCENGEVNGVFQNFGSISGFYDELINASGQDIINIQPYTACASPSPQPFSAIAISGFSPASVPAGAKEILTINGSGFGATQGGSKVWFRKNSNPSQFETRSALPILSWSDTQIELYVPDYAGSGQIGVSAGFTAPVTYSTTGLIVPYTETNIQYQQTQHVDDQSGGYIWTMNSTFSSNTNAAAAFNRARENWICETRMNWYISSSTTAINATSFDGINIIRFDSGLPSGVLGICYSYYSSCGGDYYITELDLAFNSNINWNYSENAPATNEYDFETVALHELGHGRQLGHIINASKTMNYSLGAGIQKRVISNDEKIGGLDINERSTNFNLSICGKTSMVGIICFPLGMDENNLALITMYPNPANNYITIDTNLPSSYTIYDMQGRVITLDINLHLGENLIDISTLKSGIYFVNISSEGNSFTKKLIKK